VLKLILTIILNISLLKYFIIIFLLLLTVDLSYSRQTSSTIPPTKLYENIESLEYEQNFQLTQNTSTTTLQTNIAILNQVLYFNGYKKSSSFFLQKIKEDNSDNENYIIIALIKGYCEHFYNTNKSSSFQFFFKAYSKAKNIKNEPLIRIALAAILKLYSDGILQNNTNFTNYLNHYKKLSKNKVQLFNAYIKEYKLKNLTKIHGINKGNLNAKIFHKVDSLIKFIPPKSPLINIYNYYKGNYLIHEGSIEEAQKYFFKVINNTNDKSYFLQTLKFNSYVKISFIQSQYKNFNKSISMLKKASKYKNNIKPLKSEFALKIYGAEYYAGLKKYDSAYQYIKDSRYLEYQLNFLKSNEAITQTEIENKTKETKSKLAKEEQKGKQIRNYLLGSLVLIGLGSIIGFLSIKNSRKKQLLAEQQKELETQKNLTLLKEQELITINAMVDGQEKERTRIAEDLHDNLGSVLATLKLHFENLKFNKDKKKLDQEALFNKTENLIDEAYLKVRRIAHAKNAGVIASQGLLSSIQLMAEKISSADNILIEVVHYGLEKRLENSLEIGVFRIIQELITNTIKHANASHATINLSLYDNALTIIVEDNGNGFKIEKLDLTKSMGLHAIQTRIAHFKGTITIDSTINKGTSVILNIPIS